METKINETEIEITATTRETKKQLENHVARMNYQIEQLEKVRADSVRKLSLFEVKE